MFEHNLFAFFIISYRLWALLKLLLGLSGAKFSVKPLNLKFLSLAVLLINPPVIMSSTKLDYLTFLTISTQALLVFPIIL